MQALENAATSVYLVIVHARGRRKGCHGSWQWHNFSVTHSPVPRLLSASCMITQTHSSLYLSDGNVALLAPIKEDHYMVFRVHQSFLSNLSPVFKNMFSLPIMSEEALYDGIRAVELQDCAADVESFLKVLYHQSCVASLAILSTCH